MTPPVLVAIVGAATTLSGLWVGWLTARRGQSGTVDTTEAEQLWGAASGFQNVILTEAQRLRDEVTRLRADMLDSFNQTLVLRAALVDAQKENAEIRIDNHRLRNEIAAAEYYREEALEKVRLAAADTAQELLDDPKPPWVTNPATAANEPSVPGQTREGNES